MKKLSTLLIALFFTAGMAFAQNNEATIEQLGNGYEGTINQLGDGNSAELIQGMPGWDQPNMKKVGLIEQTGDKNNANVKQKSHRSDVEVLQTGNLNIANVDVGMRTGGGAIVTARVTQIGDGNSATQDHVGSGYKPNKNYDFLSITQEGDNNAATQYQRTNYYESSAVIVQKGDGNTASQEQERNMVGDILQDGDGNTAVMIQEGKVGFAKIHQDGDFNDVSIKSWSDNNNAVVNQTGNSNNATVIQN